MPLSAERKPVPYLQSQFNESDGQISPDGRWVAYSSNESGRAEVYVQGLSSPASKWQVSTSGGSRPRWRRDREELFFRDAAVAGRTYAVSVESAGDGLRFGIPKFLFETPFSSLTGHPTAYGLYAVSGDGQRFLIPSRPSATSDDQVTPLTVVLNWTSALKR